MPILSSKAALGDTLVQGQARARAPALLPLADLSQAAGALHALGFQGLHPGWALGTKFTSSQPCNI